MCSDGSCAPTVLIRALLALRLAGKQTGQRTRGRDVGIEPLQYFPDTPWDCHICRICLHWGGLGGQCRHIWHTWKVFGFSFWRSPSKLDGTFSARVYDSWSPWQLRCASRTSLDRHKAGRACKQRWRNTPSSKPAHPTSTHVLSQQGFLPQFRFTG